MKERIRVLHVIGSSALGGAEFGLVALVDALRHSRSDSWIVCHGNGPAATEFARAAKGLERLRIPRLPRLDTTRKLRALIREVEPHVVHSHLWTADATAALATPDKPASVRVSTVWGPAFRADRLAAWPSLRRRAMSLVYRSIYCAFDGVIAISAAVADDLVDRHGVRVPRDKIRVIAPGMDAAQVRREAAAHPGLTASRPWIVSVGNLFALKGHRDLVSAMPFILHHLPQATLLLVGEGPERAILEALIQKLGLSDRVVLLGSRTDARAILKRSDVVVMPSLAEGFGLVLLEALALGRPLVATRVGGIPEIVEDGLTGLLVPPASPRALSKAVLRVLSDKDLSVRLGGRGRAIMKERFQPDTTARRTESVYCELLNGARSEED